MSEEFDKEAEREKLREKLEQDEPKRSATQEMSELLLRGATMTNQHCDRCGDPLFRENGETFCSTCRNTDAKQAAQQPAQGQAPETSPAPTADGAPTEPTQHQQPPQEGTQSAPGTETTQPESRSQLPDNAEVVAQADDLQDERRPTTPDRRPQPTGANNEVPDPRVELETAVTETARKASAATDPRTARAWLEASKEAAEALAALER
ncbi:Sjogren's syndrome/scleroderma autoantigen 1 family protein [Halolamina sp.]|jgi:UPF0148 protein|uniref:Sjogren's syndrome/scleroderma autoantigen 1 family protein n=1 Tax=Halolamina sp. TaxID=1940283 RepID=UPI000223B4E5|nr:Sjogrens syndrome scleroderma autoantigen 1 [halophilic archaeon DL31]